VIDLHSFACDGRQGTDGRVWRDGAVLRAHAGREQKQCGECDADAHDGLKRTKSVRFRDRNDATLLIFPRKLTFKYAERRLAAVGLLMSAGRTRTPAHKSPRRSGGWGKDPGVLEYLKFAIMYPAA
jgi:hypothetical protein